MPIESLKDYLLLNDEEKNSINIFQSTVKKAINNLDQHKKKLTAYRELVNFSKEHQLSNKYNLYSLLDSRLQSTEKNIQNELRNLKKAIETQEPSLLIRASVNNEILYTLLKHSAYDSYWNELWRKSSPNPQERAEENHLQVVEYKPQQTMHTFNLLQGLYFYSCYKLFSSRDSVASLSYLKFAAELGHFAALNTVVTHYMNSENSGEGYNYALAASELYWTPGYLLFAVFCYKQGLYDEALLNIAIAEKLEPYSANMITNAYQGKSLAYILRPLLEELRVSSWTGARLKLASLGHISTYMFDVLLNQANKQVQTILTEFKLTENEVSDEIDEESDMARRTTI